MRSVIFSAALSCFASVVNAQESKTATLHADKIYCDACAAVITKSLRNVPGVSKVTVDVEHKDVVVQFDSTKTNVEALTAATAKRGFPSTVRKVEP
jgi:mercuric ion binding protein